MTCSPAWYTARRDQLGARQAAVTVLVTVEAVAVTVCVTVVAVATGPDGLVARELVVGVVLRPTGAEVERLVVGVVRLVVGAVRVVEPALGGRGAPVGAVAVGECDAVVDRAPVAGVVGVVGCGAPLPAGRDTPTVVRDTIGSSTPVVDRGLLGAVVDVVGSALVVSASVVGAVDVVSVSRPLLVPSTATAYDDPAAPPMSASAVAPARSVPGVVARSEPVAPSDHAGSDPATASYPTVVAATALPCAGGVTVATATAAPAPDSSKAPTLTATRISGAFTSSSPPGAPTEDGAARSLPKNHWPENPPVPAA